jgi:transcriptional regulator with XRE-family HTH domain
MSARRPTRKLEPPVHATDGEPITQAPADSPPPWRQWMQQLGRQLRRLRELVGLSQEQLARLAGVSQGAVSRLETARGLATPMLVVVKISVAIAGELRKLDPTILDADLRRALESREFFGPSLGVLRPDNVQITSDPQLEAILRLHRETPERHRQAVLAIVAAVVSGLKDGGRPAGPTRPR